MLNLKTYIIIGNYIKIENGSSWSTILVICKMEMRRVLRQKAHNLGDRFSFLLKKGLLKYIYVTQIHRTNEYFGIMF